MNKINPSELGSNMANHYLTGSKVWKGYVALLIAMSLSELNAALVAFQDSLTNCDEKTAASQWNGAVSLLRYHLRMASMELAETRNYRSKKGQFSLRTVAEGDAIRKNRSEEKAATAAQQEEKRQQEQQMREKAVTEKDLAVAVSNEALRLGLNPAKVRDELTALLRRLAPKPTAPRKTAIA